MSSTQQNQSTLTLESIQNFTGQYPKQLWYLFGIEMWERFCFYGMRGMLTIFMVEQLMIERPNAVQQYAAIQAFIYIFTFFGGLLADKILGFKKSLFWGGLLMAIGGFIVAVSPQAFFYYGICFTVIGTGFFKPNISTMVGALYKEGDVRRESGFSLFYAGINLGAFLGGIIMIYVGLYVSWSLAFALVGVVMCLSLIMLFITKKHLGPIGNSPLENKVSDSKKRNLEIMTYIGSLAVIPLILLLIQNTQYTDYFMLIVGPSTLLYVFYVMTKMTRAENMKLIAALIFILFSVLFWALFEQSGGSLALFARYNVSHDFMGINIDPNAVNNSSNALFVILLAPVVGLLWVWLARRKMNPMAGAKFGLGFLFVALGFFVFFLLRGGADAQGLTSLELFTFGYLILTLGELCVSPIGLSLMTKLSPMSMQGIMMGMWFLASGFGHYVAGILGKGIATIPEGATPDQVLEIASSGFKTLGLYGLIAGVILLALTPVLRKLMGTVK
jgi:POT family proton-dependent oligopeptide transporter